MSNKRVHDDVEGIDQEQIQALWRQVSKEKRKGLSQLLELETQRLKQRLKLFRAAEAVVAQMNLAVSVEDCPGCQEKRTANFAPCDAHQQAEQAVVDGKLQRWCSQDNMFHLLAEFEGKNRMCKRAEREI